VRTTSSPPLTLTQTWNAGGVTFEGIKFTITDTASASASLAMQILGGAAGTTNLLSVTRLGVLTAASSVISGGNISTVAGGNYVWTTRSLLNSPTDGTISAGSNAGTGFTALNLGPLTGNTVNGTLSISQVTTIINMATATGAGTGTITSANTALPVGLILGVSCRVSPALAGTSLTTWSLGTAGDTNMYGETLSKDLNTLVNIANYTITAPWYNTATQALILTAAADHFDTGILTCTTHYVSLVPIGS
jgi:hypothetical protein